VETFDPVTRQGLAITNLFGFELVVSALLLALVLGWLVLAMVRFRARPDDASEPPQIHGNTRLETVWTVTPALFLAGVFVFMLQTMRTVDTIPPEAQTLQVIGHQWWWEYRYPDLGVVTANEVHVPVGTPLRVRLDSADVIHSFHVPHFGYMRDTVPTKTNEMSALVDRVGEYMGVCNQFCGDQHAWMRTRVIAETTDQFNAWVQQQRLPAVNGSNAAGQQVCLSNTCVSCHAIRGLPAPGTVGPDLTHFGSRATIAGGVLDNTPVNLQMWIRDTQKVKPGVLMPAFQTLSDADLTALVAYLESLR
jgi:cytochrome c oxidase subunit 2